MKNILKTVLITAFALSVILVTSCDKDSLVVPAETVHIEFVSVDFPDTVSAGSEYPVTIRARLTGKNEIDSKHFFIDVNISNEENPELSVNLSLTDNGENGDNIPGDFEFSLKTTNTKLSGVGNGTASATFIINSVQVTHIVPFKAATGLILPFTLGGSHTEYFYIAGDVNLPPSITGLSGIGDTLDYDLGDSTLIFVSVEDPDGNADIGTGNILLYLPGQVGKPFELTLHDDGLSGDAAAGDGILTGAIPHSSIAFYGNGLYTLSITASDTSGNTSEEFIYEFDAYSDKPNYPPEIIEIASPDSVKNEDGLHFFAIAVADSNGLGNIKNAYFITTNPEGTSSNTKVYLFDDGSRIIRDGGISGDVTAVDGIYSRVIEIKAGAMNGTWKIDFYVTDKNGQIDSQLKTMVIY